VKQDPHMYHGIVFQKKEGETMSHRGQIDILLLAISGLLLLTLPKKYAVRAMLSLAVSIVGVSIGYGAFPFLSF
jgi:hypothetical protein